MSIAIDQKVIYLERQVAELKEQVTQLAAALHHQANALQALQKPNVNRK